jgi:putative phage repressor
MFRGDSMGLERINDYKKIKNLTNKDISEITGISISSLDKITSGNNTNPKLETVKLICGALGCKLSDLLDDDNSKEEFTLQEINTIKKYRTLDEYGKELVTAVIDIEYKRCTYKPEPNRDDLIDISINYAPVSAGLGDELEDYEHWEKVSVPLTPESRKADFILRVDGDSMEPKFSNGDYLLVRKQPAVDIGQIGIFDVDGKGYVKKYGGDKLISLNPKYKDISTTDDSRCFGLVLGTTDIIEE